MKDMTLFHVPRYLETLISLPTNCFPEYENNRVWHIAHPGIKFNVRNLLFTSIPWVTFEEPLSLHTSDARCDLWASSGVFVNSPQLGCRVSRISDDYTTLIYSPRECLRMKRKFLLTLHDESSGNVKPKFPLLIAIKRNSVFYYLEIKMTTSLWYNLFALTR